MTISGTLIVESMRVGSVLDGGLHVTKISRAEAGDVDAGQPRTWTFLEFDAPDDDADRLSRALEGVLEHRGGWYCDFRTDEETFVVFAGRTFRYRRGDAAGRAAAADYGRSVGVPEAQLDWPV
jgi:hypothetical protein